MTSAPHHPAPGRSEPVEVWNRLVTAFLRHDRQTPAILGELIDDHPDEPMGPIIKGYMLLMLARRELCSSAQDALAEGQRRLLHHPDLRAQRYAVGLGAWLQGDPLGAIRSMEQVISDNPMDAMAIKVSHAIRFMLGDADGMRRSLARVVSVYTDQIPNAGFIKGCYAFSLEETGAYTDAENIGRKAVELEPADAWGRHAVAHVYEMTGRARDGLDWLSDDNKWRHCNNFIYHMAWHVALFQLELGRTEDALAQYDKAVRSEKTDDFRDIANAASLLQRIELQGHAVGNRWEELADIAERRIYDRQLAFADLHYLLALLGAGRFSSAETLVKGMLGSVGKGHNGSLSAEIGAHAAAGLVAFKAGRMAEAAAFLVSTRESLQAIGGSHAQRDIFEQICLEAVVRSGSAVGKTLLTERIAHRAGHNRFAQQRLNHILAGTTRGQTAADVLDRTPALLAH